MEKEYGNTGMTLDELLDNPFMDGEEEFVVETADIPAAPLLPEVIRQMQENPPYVQEMLQKIEEMDLYAYSRGSMGLDFGFECLNKAFNGLNPGLTLVAGGANTGRD